MAKPKTLDEYIAAHGDWRGGVMQELRGLVESTSRRSTSAIKWAQPVFECNGPFAFMKANKQHVTFGFWRGVELEDPKGMLEGTGDRMRHVKIKGPADVKRTAIKALIRQAVALNRDNGDPTKRAR